MAPNGRKFLKIKNYVLISKLGITVKCGPAYLQWSNRFTERNHTSADITFKKVMEGKKGLLTDTAVKAAAWNHYN